MHRLHQEDFCQALGVPPARKHASDGGPTFKRCFELARSVCTRPARGVLQLLDAAIVQVLIGNADAHGKNYSLLHDGSGRVSLAPLYDLMCTVAHPHLATDFAMKVARRGTLEDIRTGDWDRFARDCGLSAPFVRRRIGELCDLARQRCAVVADELMQPGLDAAALESFAVRVEGRAARLAATVRQGARP